jgi:hypothetical protein
MSTPANQLPDLSHLFEPPPPKMPKPRPVQPHGAFDSFTPSASSWSLSDAEKVKGYYRQTFGRDLPVTAFGESGTHRSLGLDHSNALDVGLHPDSDEGRALRGYLKQNGIPYLAYDRAVPGAATGAHIHIGAPSHGLASSPQTPPPPDLSDLFEPSGATPPEAPQIGAGASVADTSDELDPTPVQSARAVAPKPPAPPKPFDPYAPKQRAKRDRVGAAIEGGEPAAVSFVPPRGADTSVADLMRAAYLQGANQYGSAYESYVDSWLKAHPEYLKLVDNTRGDKEVTVAELLNSSAYDPKTGRVSLALHHLPELERDYKAYRSFGDRAVDWAVDPRRTAGEKFTDVVDPVVGGVAKAAGTANRYLLAPLSAEVYARARSGSLFNSQFQPDTLADVAAAQVIAGQPAPEYATNPISEPIYKSETLRNINPNLPRMVGGVVEALTDPVNLLPLGELATGAKTLRGLSGVRAVEEALTASRDARLAEFFAKGGRILDVEAPVARVAEAGEAARIGVVTFRDPEGRIFKLDTATGELSGDVPPVGTPKKGAANLPPPVPEHPETVTAQVATDAAHFPQAARSDLPMQEAVARRVEETQPPRLDHLFEPEASAPARVVSERVMTPAGSGRDVVVVEKADGSRQAFYRSTGRNSGKAGEWLPFDGVAEGGHYNGWFNKRRFAQGDLADTAHPLHRFGSEENKRISEWLGASEIPKGEQTATAGVNAELKRLKAYDPSTDKFSNFTPPPAMPPAPPSAETMFTGEAKRVEPLAPSAQPASFVDLPSLDHLFEPEHHSTRQPRTPVGTFKEGQPAPSNFVNFDRLKVSDAEKQNLSKLVSDYVAEKGYSKGRVTFDQVKKEAAKLDPSLVRDLKPVKDGETLKPAVRYAAKQRLTALNAEHAKTLDAIAAGRDSLPLDELHKLEAKAANLKRDADSMLGVLLPLRTQAGRTLAMERMTVDATGFDLEKSVARARRVAERSGVDVSGEEFQKAEGTIRRSVASAAKAQARLDELEAQIAEAQVSPEIRAAVEESAKLQKRLNRKPSEREVLSAARRAAAESYKARLTELEQAARARLREKLSPTAVHDVTDIGSMIADLSVVGASKLARGGIDKAVWAREMLEEFGESVRPHLRAVFGKSYELYQSELKAARRKAAELKVTGGDLSKFTTNEIEQLLNEAAAQRARVQRARMELAKTYASLQKTDKWSTASAIRKSNLLATVSGAARDLVSTGLFQPTEQLARIPGSLADLTLSLVSKNDRQLLSAQPASFFRATREGYKKALREIPEVLRQGASKEQLQRLELPHEINSGSRVADAYVKVVGRYRTVVDLPAFNQAEAFALRERAKLQAMAEKRAGKITDVRARAASLVAKPPDALRILAATDASEVTFHGTTKLSEAIRRGRTALSPGGNFAVDVFMPFERATSGVFHKGVQYSGLGIPEAGYRTLRALVKRELSAQEQRSISLAFGRGATGVVAFVPLGYALAARGWVTGAVDDEAGQRGLKQVAGRKPMSIYNPVRGGWINIDVLGPAALPIAIGATIFQERTQPKGATAGEYAKQVGRLAITAPQVRATGEVSRLVNDPAATLPAAGGRLTSSFVVPGVSSDIANLTDSKERDTNSFTGGLVSRIPVARNLLAEKIDSLGQTVTGQSKEGDPVVAEAMRIRLPIVKPKEKDAEAVDAFRKRLVSEGAAVRDSLSALFSSGRYKSLPDDDARRDVAAGVMEYARDAERKSLPREYVAHNALVRAEVLRVADVLRRDKSLSDEQRQRVVSAVSSRLGHVMLKRGDGRSVEEARRDFAGLLPDVEAAVPDLIRAAKERGGSRGDSPDGARQDFEQNYAPSTSVSPSYRDPAPRTPDRGQPEIDDEQAGRVARLLDGLTDHQLVSFAKGLAEFRAMGVASPLADATTYAGELVGGLTGNEKAAAVSKAMRALAREERLRPGRFYKDVQAGKYGQALLAELEDKIYYGERPPSNVRADVGRVKRLAAALSSPPTLGGAK